MIIHLARGFRNMGIAMVVLLGVGVLAIASLGGVGLGTATLVADLGGGGFLSVVVGIGAQLLWTAFLFGFDK